MNYEKLTPERFAIKLKEGAYASRTGARRAIGKADWKLKDKEEMRVLANARRWAPESGRTAKPAAKAPKVAKSTKKNIQGAKPAKRVARRAAYDTHPGKSAAPGQSVVPMSMAPQFDGNFLGAEEMRLASNSAVIAGFSGRTTLDPLERSAYEVSLREHVRLADSSSRPGGAAESAPRGRKREPKTSTSPVPESDDQASPGLKADETVGQTPRIQIPDGSHLTGEARVQHERMAASAKAVGVAQA
jgi:hypothetical protein